MGYIGGYKIEIIRRRKINDNLGNVRE